MYIEKINGPEDVKKLNIEEMTALAEEMRHALLKRASIHGGHFGPNFGMVEAIIALHYVFESPKDKMVFDVSHQTYPHKMLTGRKDAYLYEEHYDDVTGYSCPQESEHDHFTIGHTSTSISLACGLAKARDLRGESANVIAIIGDGSLSGGEALEGMDFAAELDSNMIIVVNDNDMSIAENHGGLYKGLKELRDTNGESPDNIFKAMGLEYYYLGDGHDVSALIKLFTSVKDIDRAVVLHIHTIKGKGLKYAEENKNNKTLINELIEKARNCKGLSHREAAVLLECNLEEENNKIYSLAKEIKEKFYGNRIVMFAPLYLSNYCVNGCTYCPYHFKNKHIPRKKLTQKEIEKEVKQGKIIFE